ncbi:MAG: lytic transglycosylase domain-containing protein, partial [Gemmatimonadales bacterium]|nr:lytic transglycosylase domain-containing protein [Gemmatimonadales bacterium]
LYEEGRIDQAAAEWSRIHQLDAGADGLAAGYWAARALREAGDTSRATLLWQSVMARDSVSYYAYASAARLGRPGWQPAAAPDRFTHFLDVDSAMSRIGLLKAAGMVEEASWERAWLTAERVRSPQRLLSVADAFRRLGDPDASIASARAALARGAPRDARTYRLLYPRHYEDNLAAEARAIGVDPLVVAALIRQESAWNAGARSRVGARGLMQVMPATGRLIARQLGVRGWRVDHLDEPALNLRFGTFYLGQVLQRFNGDLVRALAAYNAGPGRVPLWSVGRAADDPEMFVERIGFKETRDYVRTIQRNVALYRALYPAAPAT